MSVEISGDTRLTLIQRLQYLISNLGRNLQQGKIAARRLRFVSARRHRTPPTASPGRALTEAFLHLELPKLLPPNGLDILEIGCGSGSLTKLLAEVGYSGTYIGIDIADRFDRMPQAEFDRQFVLTDAHQFESNRKFDLVISVSALEHIADDQKLVARLGDFLRPGGLQVHFVPSGWGLFAYLWHGYRQYSAFSLSQRFTSPTTSIISMGGAASFLLHFLFITVGEVLLRVHLRTRLPILYEWLLTKCLWLDQLVPACGTMYVVCATNTTNSNGVTRI